MPNFTIKTEISILFFLLAVIFCYFIIDFFFKKDKTLSDFPLNIKKIIKILRLIVFTLLVFLALGVYIKIDEKKEIKPLLLVFIDNSQSIKLAENFNHYEKFIKNLKNKFEKLNNKYEVKFYKFDKTISTADTINFDGKLTNIGSIYDFVSNNFSELPINSLILFSDGIYNAGENPLYHNNLYKTYTVLLGDTNIYPDISIIEINYPKIVYVGSYYRIKPKIKCLNLTNQQAIIKLYKNNNLIEEKKFKITKPNFYYTTDFFLEANEPGLESLKLIVTSNIQEKNTNNNSQILKIKIESQKQIVYLLTNAIHPDIGVIKNSLEKSFKYDVRLNYIKDINIDSLLTSSAVILFTYKTNNIDFSNILKKLNDHKIPLLIINGFESNFKVINSFYSFNFFNEKIKKYDYVVIEPNKNENFLNLSENDLNTIKKFPPLSLTYGEYSVPINAEIVFFQKINNVITNFPLLFFFTHNFQKIGILHGEGLFRWRLYEYSIYKSHIITEKIINKILSYLLLGKPKKRFYIKHEPIYNVLQPIELEGFLYSLNNELINEPDVFIEIKDSADATYNFIFDKKANFYFLTIDNLLPGEYKWQAKTTINNTILTDNGKFYIQEQSLETIDLIANKEFLYQLATKTNGKFFHYSKMDNLLKELEQQEAIGKLEVLSKIKPLIDLKLLFFLLILFFFVEWFLRRYFGSF